ncbi:thermolabile hemolysin [Collimonas arenae]|uniref:Thermolabile hemolysin n=1 Tax=Collimonas arenae TaxID=279058 RepID=A0A127QGX5_9BURK|nr:SGNH/GDSL hydrolase family protein [Collimonas arenae]AMP08852.1 thermolabile hemolysin [Collimonas arenae]
MKTLFVLCTLCSSMALAQVSPDVKPDARFTHQLSSSGPLSKEQLLKQQSTQSAKKTGATSLRTEAVASTASTSTYTYLRCFYRTNNNPTKPTTTYVWGLDPSSGDYYRINGYWWAGGLLNWQNMFYSDVTQNTLQSVCQSTLTAKGISQPVAMVAAADNALSFNYTVWTTDSVAQNGINKIVAFGDSLSDNQNIYNASNWTLPNSNSWFLGHFSNGNNWVEYLAGNLQLPLYNWAIGGAGVTTQNLVIPGVIQQVQSYTTYMQKAQNYQPQNTLFTLLIGGNDLVNYNSTVDQVISGETQALQNLIQSGARNILLLKLPDVSKAPVFTIKTNGATVAAQVTGLNNRLVALVASLRAQYGSSLNIQLYDTYALFNDLLTNPAKYQVSNTTQSCLNINTDSSTNYLQTQTARSQCNNPDSFVFWDTLHPTTHTHKLLADAVTAFVSGSFANLSSPGK